MTKDQINKETVYKCLEHVNDPEVPVFNVIDLGIVRDVVLLDEDEVEVEIGVERREDKDDDDE